MGLKPGSQSFEMIIYELKHYGKYDLAKRIEKMEFSIRGGDVIPESCSFQARSYTSSRAESELLFIADRSSIVEALCAPIQVMRSKRNPLKNRSSHGRQNHSTLPRRRRPLSDANQQPPSLFVSSTTSVMVTRASFKGMEGVEVWEISSLSGAISLF